MYPIFWAAREAALCLRCPLSVGQASYYPHHTIPGPPFTRHYEGPCPCHSSWNRSFLSATVIFHEELATRTRTAFPIAQSSPRGIEWQHLAQHRSMSS